MRSTLAARALLDDDLRRLRDEHLIVVELPVLIDLVREPDNDPLVARPGPQQRVVDDLAATLVAARRLPDDLTVKVMLPEGGESDPAVPEVEAAFRRQAEYRATVAWREGMAQRAMGLSQLPLGLTVAAMSWFAAYVAGYFATGVEGVWVGVLAVTAMLTITIAWVVSWVVVELTALDWRLGARSAHAYELLSRASLQVDRWESSGTQT